MTTLAERFRSVAESQPDHTAIISGGQNHSYGSLAVEIADLAKRLQEAGAGRGSRVGVALPNGPAFVRAFFSIAHIGGIVVPINPALREPEIAALLEDSGASLVLSHGELQDRCETAARALPAAQAPGTLQVPNRAAEPGRDSRTDARWPATTAEAADPVLYLYSSGSTGKPKRIVRSHYNLLFETERLTSLLGFSPEDRVIGVAPFSHVNGLTRSMIASMLSGATLVPLPRYERREVADTIQRERVSIFIGVPFMFAVLAETRWPEPVDFSSLRYCVSASAPLPRDTSVAFHDRYGLFVRQLYGCSETGTISLNLGERPEETLESVGTPIPGVEVEIFAEDGKISGAGQEGDIGIRSPAATTEYPGLPEATAAAFRDGYFFPGDVGRTDEAGNVYLVGRKSLFINCGGYKVNPYEVEQVLERHASVRQAVVVGMDTPYGDQRVRAVVVPEGECSRETLVAHCRDGLADFKVPSVIEIRDGLPTSATGKVLRTEL